MRGPTVAYESKVCSCPLWASYLNLWSGRLMRFCCSRRGCQRNFRIWSKLGWRDPKRAWGRSIGTCRWSRFHLSEPAARAVGISGRGPRSWRAASCPPASWRPRGWWGSPCRGFSATWPAHTPCIGGAWPRGRSSSTVPRQSCQIGEFARFRLDQLHYSSNFVINHCWQN